MIIKVISICSAVDFLEKLKNLEEEHREREKEGRGPGHPTTFRGQRECKPLLPSLTRPEGPGVHEEERIIKEFRRRIYSQPSDRMHMWEVVIIGQHYRLPTRLLDWTESPLVALFFAVQGKTEKDKDGRNIDSVVIGTHHHRLFVTDLREEAGEVPWSIRKTGPYFFIPDYSNERIFPQRSVLSVWQDPTTPFEELSNVEVWQFKIPAFNRGDIQAELDKIGINEETLFPGLEGVSKYLAWKFMPRR